MTFQDGKKLPVTIFLTVLTGAGSVVSSEKVSAIEVSIVRFYMMGNRRGRKTVPFSPPASGSPTIFFCFSCCGCVDWFGSAFGLQRLLRIIQTCWRNNWLAGMKRSCRLLFRLRHFLCRGSIRCVVCYVFQIHGHGKGNLPRTKTFFFVKFKIQTIQFGWPITFWVVIVKQFLQ